MTLQGLQFNRMVRVTFERGGVRGFIGLTASKSSVEG